MVSIGSSCRVNWLIDVLTRLFRTSEGRLHEQTRFSKFTEGIDVRRVISLYVAAALLPTKVYDLNGLGRLSLSG
jgi:hypothetical protein